MSAKVTFKQEGKKTLLEYESSIQGWENNFVMIYTVLKKVAISVDWNVGCSQIIRWSIEKSCSVV